MASKREKVLKTYGRHRSRIIKTDFWDDNIKTTIQTFGGSSDFTPDKDFVTPDNTNVKKRKTRKWITEQEKENRCRKEKRITGEKLFIDKSFVSSFSDSFKEPLPQFDVHLKKTQKSVVPPSAYKKRLPNLTKLNVESPGLCDRLSEKSLSMHFSDFDDYELCISESPIPANPHEKNFPRVTALTDSCDQLSQTNALTSDSSDQLSQTNALTSDSSDQLPQTNDLLRDKRSRESLEKVSVKTKAGKSKISTSTPVYLPVVRLERSAEADEHLRNLYNTSRENLSSYKDNDVEVSIENGANYNSMFSSELWSDGHPTPFPQSELWSGGHPAPSPNDQEDNTTSLEIYSSAKKSPFDCVVQLDKLHADVEHVLNTDSYISFQDYSPSLFGDSFSADRSKQDKKLKKKQLSLLLSSCTNCSLQQPCGNDCAYMKYMVSSRPFYDLLSDIGDSSDHCLDSVDLVSSPDFVGSNTESKSKWLNDDNESNMFNASIQHINSLLQSVLFDSDEDVFEDACDTSMENNRDLALNDIEEEEEQGGHEKEDIDDVHDVTPLSDEDNLNTSEHSWLSDSILHSGNPKKCLQSSVLQQSPYEICSRKINSQQKHSSKQTVTDSLLSGDEEEDEEDNSINPDNCSHSVDAECFRNLHLSDSQWTTPQRRSLLCILSPVKYPLSPKSKILKQCQQEKFISFADCIRPHVMQKCVKIGEGVYGEVFRTTKAGESVALKIIPIEGNFNVNECAQKNFAEILPEIVISQELSELRFGITDQTRNFILVNNVSCVKGKYPGPLMKQWDIFHKNKQSYNDRPDIFSCDQLFVVFEFGDGGNTLEEFKLNNLRQAKNILLQVVYSLAVAESAVEFEHRDLHWGNVLVHPCPDDVLNFSIKGVNISLPLMGMQASIIDFTLSRLSKDGCTVFCDLSIDEEIFQGTGDYQFDVYRKMRDETEDQWSRYCPKTNVLWIHYLADKLLNCKKYEQVTRADREILRSLRQFVNEATQYMSAVDLVFSCDFMQISDV